MERGATPADEYRRRLAARAATLVVAERRHRILARVRMAVFLCAVVVAWLAFDRAALSPAWLLAPIVLFAALVLVHLRVGDQCKRARLAVSLYEDGLARIENRWVGRGARSIEVEERDHLYAADLDLFGHGSLFERLARTRTRAGERALAGWLVAPAAAATVRDRQAAVRDLAPRLDLREDLAVAADEPGRMVDTDRLAAWGRDPAASGPSRGAAVAAALGSALTLIAGAVGLLFDFGTTFVIPAILFQLGVELSQRRAVAQALSGIDRAGRDLDRLVRVLTRIEGESFAASRLRALASDLEGEGRTAARSIGALRRRIELLDSGRNFLFAPIAIWLSWRLHLARAIGDWRRTHGARIATWLAAIGEIEALDSLAAYAFERPDDPFPEISPDAEPLFVAEGLAHPLLPAEACVRNDVHLGDAVRVLVVSGSNMSGKSTLLRAIGVNAVLALAGAPVCARGLRLSVLSIGASIRVGDSLLEGSSRFQAEIERLKRIVDLAAAGPTLFLLDEILHGTNSHDRRIGAEAVVRTLLARGAIGLVTTHDLALTEIAAPGSRLANVHFVDHLENGRMRFDYRMHPGVVARSNALELMRAVGLDVEPPAG